MKCLLAVLFVITLAVMPTSSQTEQWSVLLLNSTNFELLQVYADGTTVSHDLGLPDDFFDDISHVSISSDGSLLAACKGDYTNFERPTFTLMVFDLTMDSLVSTTDLGVHTHCDTGQYAFSPDAKQVSVSLLNVTGTSAGWELLNLDVATGTVLHRLTDQSPEVRAVSSAPAGMFPNIRAVNATSISFAMGTWPFPSRPSIALTWDFVANTVTNSPEWAAFRASTLVTEAGVTSALIGLDENLPADDIGGMISSNFVQVTEPGADPVIVYINTEDVIDFRSASFINNGESLAIQVFEGDPPGSEVVTGSYWVTINRDGSRTLLTNEPPVIFTPVFGAPNGFLLLIASEDPTSGTLTFQLDYTTGDTTRTLWTNAGDASNRSWNIIWVSPSPVSGDLPPFQPVSPPPPTPTIAAPEATETP
jgi:hypothetical protein